MNMFAEKLKGGVAGELYTSCTPETGLWKPQSKMAIYNSSLEAEEVVSGI